MDDMDGDHEKFMQNYQANQIKEAKRNVVLRERLLGLAEEAARTGLI